MGVQLLSRYQALRKYIGRICHIYLDDIVIWSNSVDEHRDNVRTILQALRCSASTLGLTRHAHDPPSNGVALCHMLFRLSRVALKPFLQYIQHLPEASQGSLVGLPCLSATRSPGLVVITRSGRQESHASSSPVFETVGVIADADGSLEA